MAKPFIMVVDDNRINHKLFGRYLKPTVRSREAYEDDCWKSRGRLPDAMCRRYDAT
jgi:hypothetical protein